MDRCVQANPDAMGHDIEEKIAGLTEDIRVEIRHTDPSLVEA